MARARVSISVDTRELAILADALRVYSEVILADITGVSTDVQFNDAVCDGNWHNGYIKVEELRSQLGDGDIPSPNVQPQGPQKRKKKGRGTASQVKGAGRTVRKARRLLRI